MNKTLLVFLLSLATPIAANAADAAPHDVEMLPSGVRVEHLQRGDGPLPSASSTVLVDYHGTLSDGTVFDSSIERKQPIAFPLRNVIPCWTQGVQRMKVGGKAILTCPSRTAYGEAGAGNKIPPNATLNFEVHLLEIQ
ncbi:MAG TPA: FKBP-type peptidyl-prolyl cis-trans isomerase [Thauera sp.]|jgi:FKBP-type peptidyl-prolyl cis-trans isomerase FkpA|nr:FKBP-type peptidyl-prolyl cis-trans isomerase [Thauera sp.]HRA80119.1 FKBP-type peptidyl-prolyl cis-trans isomerase [Thauera sp.]